MKVQVRMSGKMQSLDVSKSMKVKELRKRIELVFGVEPRLQRLLFKGKQLEDGCDLLTYRVNVNDIVDLHERMEIMSDDKAKPDLEEPEFAIDPDFPMDPEILGESIAEEVYFCTKCKNNDKRKCKECGCNICGIKVPEDQMLACDECTYYFHMTCLDPVIEKVPDGEWYCPDCDNSKIAVVKPGEDGSKYKRKTKPSQRVSSKENCKWGRGMANAGRSKTSDIPKHYFGPITGVEVGMCWKNRLQVSEVGIHLPPVAGMSGQKDIGCQSIVLAGGYEDDTDDGYEFSYTGSGGRDLSGNKRTSVQSFDQELDRSNLALARNCACPINTKNGGEANDWKSGKPVRVVRSDKLKKHLDSKYVPQEGYRYDGIYKVVKYWPETGKSGFRVWRYLLRRDDPSPAPWEPEATKYPCIHPNKEEALAEYAPSTDLKAKLLKDEQNKSLWMECLDFKGNSLSWHDNVKTLFSCVICQELMRDPVTLPCNHNNCLECLKRMFKANCRSCPHCRHSLEEDYKPEVNKECETNLKTLFPYLASE